MRFNDFQRLAARTANTSADSQIRRDACALGLYGEAGELCDWIKKEHAHAHPKDPLKVLKESGDCLWYIAEAASIDHKQLEALTGKPSGSDFASVPGSNPAKLAKLFARTMADMGNAIDYGGISGPSVHFAMQTLSLLLAHYGHTLDDAMGLVIAKLEKRYPEGFTGEASMARADVTQAEGEIYPAGHYLA